MSVIGCSAQCKCLKAAPTVSAPTVTFFFSFSTDTSPGKRFPSNFRITKGIPVSTDAPLKTCPENKWLETKKYSKWSITLGDKTNALVQMFSSTFT